MLFIKQKHCLENLESQFRISTDHKQTISVYTQTFVSGLVGTWRWRLKRCGCGQLKFVRH